jgi:hypothetical protein
MRSFLIFDLSVAGFIFRSFAAPILSSNVAIRHFQSHHNTLGYKLGYQLIKPAERWSGLFGQGTGIDKWEPALV